MTVLQEINDITRTMQLELPVRGKLLFMLEARQSMGKKKYGHTIDRNDLTREQWAQHLLEELLDGAQYAVKADKQEIARMLLIMAAAIIEEQEGI